VFCLYLMLLLFLITVMLYAWLSGMNDKRANLCNTIISGLSTLIYSATLFHICNYAHYMANTVRYQWTSHEYIYIYVCVYIYMYIYTYIYCFPLYYRLTSESRSFGTNYCFQVLSTNVPYRKMALTQYSTICN